MREVYALSAPKAHDAAELLFGAPKAPVICSHFVKCAEHMLTRFVKYAEAQSQSYCYLILLNMQSHSREATVVMSQSRSDYYFPIVLNMRSHSREATVTPRRRGEAASFIYYQDIFSYWPKYNRSDT